MLEFLTFLLLLGIIPAGFGVYMLFSPIGPASISRRKNYAEIEANHLELEKEISDAEALAEVEYDFSRVGGFIDERDDDDSLFGDPLFDDPFGDDDFRDDFSFDPYDNYPRYQKKEKNTLVTPKMPKPPKAPKPPRAPEPPFFDYDESLLSAEERAWLNWGDTEKELKASQEEIRREFEMAKAEFAKLQDEKDSMQDLLYKGFDPLWQSSTYKSYSKSSTLPTAPTPEHSQRPRAEERVAAQDNTARLWDKLFAQHDEALDTWAEYELNLEMALKYPFVTDVSDPLVMSMMEAMNRASMLRPESGSDTVSPADSPYATAVVEFTTRLNGVIHAAKKAAWSNFTPAERKRLDKASQMLRLAQDAGASPHERQAAYKRILVEVEGLIVLPETPLAALESAVRKELTTN